MGLVDSLNSKTIQYDKKFTLRNKMLLITLVFQIVLQLRS